MPLAETLEAFDELVRAGKIRYWGINNFDVLDMDELFGLTGGAAVQIDEVSYNLTRRDIEYELVPWCRRRSIPIMACSPLEQGRMLDHPELKRIAADCVATPAQIALAWTVRGEHVTAIPRTGAPGHVRQNRVALDLPVSNRTLPLWTAPFRRRRRNVPSRPSECSASQSEGMILESHTYYSNEAKEIR